MAMFDSPLAGTPLATGVVVMLAVVAVDWLGRTRRFRMVGAAMLALILGAVLANLRVIPPATGPHPVYDAAFTIVAPLMIFLLLLEARLASLRRAGGRMLLAFSLGGAGTVLGIIVALWLVPVRESLGQLHGPIAGMFTATFIGGSANLNAVALHYDITSQGGVYGGAVAVVNALTAAWMAFVLAAPSLLSRLRWWPAPGPLTEGSGATHAPSTQVVPLPDSLGLAAPLTLSLLAMLLSNAAAGLLASSGLPVPSVLILTTLALVVAQFEWAARMTLARPLALLAVNAFLIVVGASADLAVLMQKGTLAVVLFAYVAVLLAVHGVFVYGVGALLRIDLGTLSCASFANIGGPATAPAVAEGIGRDDLVLPSVLAGVLGAAIGTYVGFAVAVAVG
jgi:uncharacterized membrane protein